MLNDRHYIHTLSLLNKLLLASVKICIIYSMYSADEVSVHRACSSERAITAIFLWEGVNSGRAGGKTTIYSQFSYSQVSKGKANICI